MACTILILHSGIRCVKNIIVQHGNSLEGHLRWGSLLLQLYRMRLDGSRDKAIGSNFLCLLKEIGSLVTEGPLGEEEEHKQFQPVIEKQTPIRTFSSNSVSCCGSL